MENRNAKMENQKIETGKWENKHKKTGIRRTKIETGKSNIENRRLETPWGKASTGLPISVGCFLVSSI
jgi:hypothetical protein